MLPCITGCCRPCVGCQGRLFRSRLVCSIPQGTDCTTVVKVNVVTLSPSAGLVGPEIIAAHGLAVMTTEAPAQPSAGLDDQREAGGPVVAGAAVETNAVAVLASDDAEAIVLDLVQPQRARGWALGLASLLPWGTVLYLYL